MSLPLGVPEKNPGESESFNWWFFNKGVVLDINSAFFRDSGSRAWEAFLKILLKNRSQRALDGIILVFNAKEFFVSEAANKTQTNNLIERATIYYDRLMAAQKVLGLQFPVYILVSQCDQISGFKSFCGELPEKYKDNIFGWSNPYKLETGYTSSWVGEAFESMSDDLYRTQMQILASDISPDDRDGIFLFPQEFHRFKEPLQITIDHVFRKSVYQDSFYFRGLYFCGDPGAADLSSLYVQEDQEEKSNNKSELEGSKDSLSPEIFSGTPRVLIDEAKAVDLDGENGGKTFFLKDLFEKKIFLESRLARPTLKVFQWRGKASLIARVMILLVALTWGIGLVDAYYSLSKEKQVLTEFLGDVSVDLRERHEMVDRQMNLDSSVFEEDTLDLLKGMTKINTSSFSSIFIPTSLFSSIDEDMEKMMVRIYNEIILKSILYGLKAKAKQINSSDYWMLGSPETVDILNRIEDSPEFVNWKYTVDAMEELHQNANIYNTLYESKDLVKLASVIKYAFGLTLPKSFYDNAAFYHDALGEVDYKGFNEARYADGWFSLMENQSETFFRKLIGHNPALTQIEEHISLVNAFYSRDIKNVKAEELSSFLKKLLMNINNLQSTLTKNEFSLISGLKAVKADKLDLGISYSAISGLKAVKADKLDLGISYSAILKGIQKNPYLGLELRQEIEKNGNDQLGDFRSRLLVSKTDMTGFLFLKDKKSMEVKLSPLLVKLKGSLDNYFAQRYLNAAEKEINLAIDSRPNTRIVWDLDLLRKNIELAGSYKKFIKDGIPEFPKSLQAPVKKVATVAFKKAMLSQISQAKTKKTVRKEFSFVGLEDDLIAEMRIFKESSTILRNVMDEFYAIGDTESSNKIFKIVSSQAYRLLADVDRLAKNEWLYQFDHSNISRWNGASPVSLAAFDVNDSTDLEYYLKFQLQRIKYLAEEYAEPLLGFLLNQPVNRTADQEKLISKWDRIVIEIGKYTSKNTQNSISRLQNFVLLEMNKIGRNDCNGSLDKPVQPTVTLDFFSKRLVHLRQQILERCTVLLQEDMSSSYLVIEKFFNENLAGKFPFSELTDKQIRNEADPADVTEFFRLFDSYIENKNLFSQKDKNFDLSKSKVIQFIKEVKEVRSFLAPFSDIVKADQPVYFIAPYFRVNRNSEILGNEVIEWKIEVGKNYYSSKGKGKKLLHWGVGDPLSVSFRWAKDAPHFPLLTMNSTRVKVADGRVTYKYTNRWSLVALIMRHNSAFENFEILKDSNPQTLKFKVNSGVRNKAKQTSNVPHKTLEAKLFIGMDLKTSKKKQVIKMPDFPIHAPHLSFN